ncbi:hypothetical protein B4086_5511 [Bacillus cereus]|uniref:hypothetical protein n=1 Tax=Bacillus cereus TaxID=1396 RepID=UPI00062D5527|nr:hypothetical protein [Bacillus cereus]KLA07035.1 hypothetical protein B4086_5511 [Bacillus cereus]PGR83704.1 hypothetical protein COC63_06870 [Bacillus cereus]
MSKMSETLMGLLIFSVFALVFVIQGFVAMMTVNQYSKNTTEMTQIIRETGGLSSEAVAYGDHLKKQGITYQISDSNGGAVSSSKGYTGKTLYVKYNCKLKFSAGFEKSLNLNREDAVFITKRD